MAAVIATGRQSSSRELASASPRSRSDRVLATTVGINLPLLSRRRPVVAGISMNGIGTKSAGAS
jgi:hypothetical protein